eukprot:gene5517-4148_t
MCVPDWRAPSQGCNCVLRLAAKPCVLLHWRAQAIVYCMTGVPSNLCTADLLAQARVYCDWRAQARVQPGSYTEAADGPGYSLEATEKLLMGQIELIKQDGPTEAELARVKKSARAGLLSLLQSNSEYGSYKEINREMEAIEAVTAEDVLQVARTLLRPDNCFSGYVLKA